MTKKHLAIEISKEKVIIRVMDGSRVEWESQAKLDPRWLPSDLLTWAEFAINKISVKTKRLGKTLKIREETMVYDDDWA